MKTVILTVVLGLVFFNVKSQVNEHTKHKMFCSAIENTSTSPNYIVILVKDKKTNLTKEVCTEAPFLEGAIGKETGNWNLDCKDYNTRKFEFSNDSALWNISFNLYSEKELKEYESTINIPKLVKKIKKGKLISITFTNEEKEQRMFAHLMFNNGVMMSRGSWASNICELTYFKK